MAYDDENGQYGGSPWFRPSPPDLPGDWHPGTGSQLLAGLVLEAGPWFLALVLIVISAQDAVLIVAVLLLALACASLAVGAATTQSLSMRLLGWPETASRRANLNAAWIEMAVLFVIMLTITIFNALGQDRAREVGMAVCLVGGVSAVLLVSTGRSLGRRLLPVLENL